MGHARPGAAGTTPGKWQQQLQGALREGACPATPRINPRADCLLGVAEAHPGASCLPPPATNGLARLAAFAVTRLLVVLVALDVLEQALFQDKLLEHAQGRLDPAVVDDNGQ